MRTLRDNFLVHFIVASCVALMGIALVLSLVLSSSVRSNVVENATDDSLASNKVRILSLITLPDLQIPMEGDRYNRFHEFVQKYIVSERTARVVLWSADGTITYSSDPQMVGKTFPEHKNFLGSMAGHDIVELPSDVKQDESQ
jgi:hypothetical protein